MHFYPATHDEAKKSMELSLRWAKRSRDAKTRDEVCQFGIVQGGVYEDLEEKSIEGLLEIGFSKEWQSVVYP